MLGGKRNFVGLQAAESARKLYRAAPHDHVAASIIESIETCDMMVINGEGDLILNRQRHTMRFLFALIELCAYMNTPVAFVNAMVSQCPQAGRDKEMVRLTRETLGKCVLITLRDPASHALLAEIAPDVEATMLPDALFTWREVSDIGISEVLKYPDSLFHYPLDRRPTRLSFGKPYVLLAGSSVFSRNQPDRLVENYVSLYRDIKQATGLRPILMQPCPGDKHLLHVAQIVDDDLIPVTVPTIMAGALLANAAALVSGRFHPSVMASTGGTPIVAMNSNSHKMFSLQSLLEYPNPQEFDANPDSNMRRGICDRLNEYLHNESMRAAIKHRASQLALDASTLPSMLLDAVASVK